MDRALSQLGTPQGFLRLRRFFPLFFACRLALISCCIYGGFLKWWYPTTMGFPTKNDHFGVFWGYHHLRKHPYTISPQFPAISLTDWAASMGDMVGAGTGGTMGGGGFAGAAWHAGDSMFRYTNSSDSFPCLIRCRFLILQSLRVNWIQMKCFSPGRYNHHVASMGDMVGAGTGGTIGCGGSRGAACCAACCACWCACTNCWRIRCSCTSQLGNKSAKSVFVLPQKINCICPQNCLQAFPLQALLLHPLLIFSCLETIYRREPLGKALLIWNVWEVTTSS